MRYQRCQLSSSSSYLRNRLHRKWIRSKNSQRTSRSCGRKHYPQPICSFFHADEKEICKQTSAYRLIFQPSDFRNPILKNHLFYAVFHLNFTNWRNWRNLKQPLYVLLYHIFYKTFLAIYVNMWYYENIEVKSLW